MGTSMLSEYQARAQYLAYKDWHVGCFSPFELFDNTANNDETDVLALPVVVFLHGFPSASSDWKAQWQGLKDTHYCIGLDFLGFGISDKPYPHQYSLHEQADIVELLFARLVARGITDIHLVAHDYGVSVAQELLARQQQQLLALRIHSVVFMNGGLFAALHKPILTQKLLKSPLGGLVSKLMSKRTLASGFAKIFGPHTQPQPDLIDELWDLLNVHQGRRVIPKLLSYIDERYVNAQRWQDALTQASIPLTFINGVHDPISGQHMLDEFERLLPETDNTPLDVGHYPQVEAPEAVTQALRDFWAKLSSVT